MKPLKQSFPHLEKEEPHIVDVFWSNDVKSQAIYYYKYSLKPLEVEPPLRRTPLAPTPVITHEVKLVCGHRHIVKIRDGHIETPHCPGLQGIAQVSPFL